MSANSNSVKIETLRQLAGGSWGTYQALGSVLAHPARILKFTNNGSKDLFISIDGVNAFEIIPTGSFLLLDLASNKQLSNIWYWPANTQFYAKTVDGTAGAASDIIYLSVYHD